jgi:hypothetical protein
LLRGWPVAWKSRFSHGVAISFLLLSIYRAGKESGEEQLVMYADKFHSKTDPPVFLTANAYASIVRHYGAGKAALRPAGRR